ncbi:nucleotidyltransferase domain-containing protein [Marinobacterium sp. MBR-109]|jgi:predicted nucleotidyltransferase|uniref:nucleotidyltransferase domain-containing protein n=1 Tax=Marinobacterium sp. MBR-109 TaxID=3156462 RepID=UPI003397F362
MLETLQAELKRYPEVQRAILFGSRAMGTHRHNSDIDLCLDAPELPFQSFLQLAASLDERVLPYSLDLILKHHIDNPELIAHIQRVGQLVYDREMN